MSSPCDFLNRNSQWNKEEGGDKIIREVVEEKSSELKKVKDLSNTKQ